MCNDTMVRLDFFFNDTATTEMYTLSLHDAIPIYLSDERIVAGKYVSLSEEYLADHFPTFPVLPGGMMLEAVTQAAGWLLHRRHDFARSMAVLKEARNVKYGNFVAPGNFLRVEVEAVKVTDAGGVFKAVGTVADAQA